MKVMTEADLEEDSLYEYGDLRVHLHKGDAAFIPNIFSPNMVHVIVIIKRTCT